MIAHLGMLRHRVSALWVGISDVPVIWKVLTDLEQIHRLLPKAEGHDRDRARWLRDCLDDELHQRLTKAEAMQRGMGR